MMKKFLTVLVLGLAVFAVSCSKEEIDETKLATFVATITGVQDVVGTDDTSTTGADDVDFTVDGSDANKGVGTLAITAANTTTGKSANVGLSTSAICANIVTAVGDDTGNGIAGVKVTCTPTADAVATGAGNYFTFTVTVEADSGYEFADDAKKTVTLVMQVS